MDYMSGKISKSEINGDNTLTSEEMKVYSVMRWKELFLGLADNSPLENFSIQDNPQYFRCLLETEPGATPGRHYTNLALNLLVKHYCPANADILDVGCGDAGFVYRMERCCISGNYLGIDIRKRDSWKHAEGRKSHKIKAKFSELSAAHMDFEELFDFSVSSHSLEHHEFPQEAITKTYLAMKPGAFGLFFVPSPWAYFLYGQHGWRNFSPKLIYNLFHCAGFQIEKIYGLGGLPSFMLHVFVISWLETAKIYEILAFGRLHWRLR